MASNPGFTQLCPHCQIPLLLRDPSWIGKLVECPKCRNRFVVEDPAKKPSAVDLAQREKETLIRKDKEAVRDAEQARKEALIQKDKEAVRGKPDATPAAGDGQGAKADALSAKTRPAPPARDKAGLGQEPLFAGGTVPQGKGVRGGHRKQAKREDGGVNLSIIITPMLDMAFQLLAFFVMTYHPSALEGHIDGTLLPPSKIAIKGPKTPDNVVPVDQAPDDKDVVTVIIKSVKRGQTEGKRGEGEPSQILIKRQEDAANPEVVADSDQDLDTGLKKLKEKLKSLQTKGTKATVNIEADSDLKHQYFIRVYDACKGANFENVGFVAPPDGLENKK